MNNETPVRGSWWRPNIRLDSDWPIVLFCVCWMLDDYQPTDQNFMGDDIRMKRLNHSTRLQLFWWRPWTPSVETRAETRPGSAHRTALNISNFPVGQIYSGLKITNAAGG